MLKIYLKRTEESDQGTFGYIAIPELGVSYYTAELPWRDNKRGISCIPKGRYILSPFSSEKHPNTYLVENVQDRDSILIHIGNYSGDESKGFKSDSDGCILLGKGLGYLGKQRAIISSKQAIKEFVALVSKYPLELIIE